MSDEITTSTNLEQLVVFTLSNESFGMDIGKVSGIERMMAITKVPRSPEFVEGVVNLRGRVIPVVDLRKVFCLPAGEETKDTRIVVVDIRGQHIGCLVDEVSEVLRIPSDSVEPPSSLVTSSTSCDYLLGIAKLEGRMIILLDLDEVLSIGQIEILAGMENVTTVEEAQADIEMDSTSEEAETKKTIKAAKASGKKQTAAV